MSMAQLTLMTDQALINKDPEKLRESIPLLTSEQKPESLSKLEQGKSWSERYPYLMLLLLLSMTVFPLALYLAFSKDKEEPLVESQNEEELG